MLRIHKIADTRSSTNRIAIEEAQAIIRAQFPGMPPESIDKLADQLESPFQYGLVSVLFLAEDRRDNVRGLALLRYAPDLKFAYLDVMSTAPGRSGGGLGAALYEPVREESLAFGAKGLYFECLPDEPALSPDPKTRAQNRARLKFYERYGALPILGTGYEQPVEPGTTDSPYLVFDGLGQFKLPPAKTLRQIMRAILERKYGGICPPEYVERVVKSVDAKTVHLRAPRYTPEETRREAAKPGAKRTPVPVIANEKHFIHHVRERGYVEAPARISAILAELDRSGLFAHVPAKHFGSRFIREVHDGGLVDFIERACKEAPLRKSLYPYVFPIRNPTRRPIERSVLAGYWCIDTFTPVNRNAYPAARGAVDCALTAAELVHDGVPLAYALVRPPGHHAERRAFGGFCYFNNSAVAAQYLSRYGRVAVLDIDYHHGNGTQDIFYERNDVLTASVHGHPRFAYPYFTGFRDERGRGAGSGFNLNLPLQEKITPEQHRGAVATALRRVARHKPAYLVLALGLDTAAGDPTGTWSNRAVDFKTLGRMIGEAGLPTVVVQEGGYRIRTLGINARNFFTGLTETHAISRTAPPRRERAILSKVSVADIEWRNSVTQAGAESIRQLVESTRMFTSPEADIAVELVNARVAQGRASGYEFKLGLADGRLVAYACYGPTAGTDGRYDLYWIAVSPEAQGHGIGRALFAQVEAAVLDAGGTRIFADTSSTEKYAGTRRFYREMGFRKAAEIPDFYRNGDDKVIYAKEI